MIFHGNDSLPVGLMLWDLAKTFCVSMFLFLAQKNPKKLIKESSCQLCCTPTSVVKCSHRPHRSHRIFAKSGPKMRRRYIDACSLVGVEFGSPRTTRGHPYTATNSEINCAMVKMDALKKKNNDEWIDDHLPIISIWLVHHPFPVWPWHIWIRFDRIVSFGLQSDRTVQLSGNQVAGLDFKGTRALWDFAMYAWYRLYLHIIIYRYTYICRYI